MTIIQLDEVRWQLLERCELSKKWEVVTPCDAACGKGHFKVMKQAC